MEAYSKEFSVDITGFDWVEYFGPEGLGCLLNLPFSLWLRHFGWRDDVGARRNAADFEITIRDLTDWAGAGSWTPPHKRKPGEQGVAAETDRAGP